MARLSPGSVDSAKDRKLGLTPKEEQSALYRERIWRKSFGMSRSEEESEEGLTRGN